MHTQNPNDYPRLFSLVSLFGMRPEDVILPPFWLGAVRLGAKLAVILAAVYVIHLAMDWATTRAAETANESLMIGVLAMLLLAYALLIAVPFMPGIEIGISLLMLKGAAIAPLVYLATVLGLLIAFAAGRFLPQGWLRGLLADMRLRRACALIDQLAPMTRRQRLDHLTQRAPSWLRPMIGPGRYVLLAVLLNMPGNTVIGGGGGIAFISGFSRLYKPVITVIVIALAVLPVPLIVWLSGSARLVM